MRRMLAMGGVAALLAMPAGAHALGTATVSGDTYSYEGVWDFGELHVVASGDASDDITFSDDLLGVTVRDAGIPLAGIVDDAWASYIGVPPNPTCTDDRGTRTCVSAPMACTSGLGAATCSQRSPNAEAMPELASITADGGPGDDRIVIPQIQLATANYAYGGSGDDSLRASYVIGGPGSDTLDGFVLYDGEPGAIAATDDGVADDGLPGEGDDVLPGSGVTGTPFSDRIALAGGGDAYGGAGDDRLVVASGQAHGDDGADSIGVTGTGFADGGAGDDAIDVRNGVANTVMCGAGDDTVIADALDRTPYGDCEHVIVG